MPRLLVFFSQWIWWWHVANLSGTMPLLVAIMLVDVCDECSWVVAGGLACSCQHEMQPSFSPFLLQKPAFSCCHRCYTHANVLTIASNDVKWCSFTVSIHSSSCGGRSTRIGLITLRWPVIFVYYCNRKFTMHMIMTRIRMEVFTAAEKERKEWALATYACRCSKRSSWCRIEAHVHVCACMGRMNEWMQLSLN